MFGTFDWVSRIKEGLAGSKGSFRQAYVSFLSILFALIWQACLDFDLDSSQPHFCEKHHSFS